jgi:hypothetical protein
MRRTPSYDTILDPSQEVFMIVVRDIFRHKFGQAKDVTALWKQAMELLKKSGIGVRSARLLSDVAGPPYYTIIFETEYDSLAQWEQAHSSGKTNQPFRDVYQKIIALTEDGHREILSVVA